MNDKNSIFWAVLRPKKGRGPTDTNMGLGPQNPNKKLTAWWTFWVTCYLEILYPTFLTLDPPTLKLLSIDLTTTVYMAVLMTI